MRQQADSQRCIERAALDRRGFLLGSAAGLLALSTGTAKARARKPFFRADGASIGLQLYTLGDAPARDLPGTLARVAAIGYQEIEIPTLFRYTPQQWRAAADAAGVRLTSLHMPTGVHVLPGSLLLTSDVQKIVDTLGVLGVANAVLPIALLPDKITPRAGEAYTAALARALTEAGVDGWKRTAALLNERAAALKPHGITLGYHNHNVEFAPVGNTTGWDVLMRETDPRLVNFEMDVGWVAAAGRDPVALLQSCRGRVRQLHVKDLLSETINNFALSIKSTQVGAGRLDWRAILATARAVGVKHYYVEQEPPFVIPPIESVTKSYAYLSKLTV